MGGRGSSGGGGKGRSGGAKRSLRNEAQATRVQEEITKLETERRKLVDRFSKAEDAGNTKRMNQLRNMIDSNDRERRNAEKRYRLYKYGEA